VVVEAVSLEILVREPTIRTEGWPCFWGFFWNDAKTPIHREMPRYLGASHRYYLREKDFHEPGEEEEEEPDVSDVRYEVEGSRSGNDKDKE
jgi:hypothetical protein